MKISVSGLLNVVLVTMLVTALFFVAVRSASPPPYDPWADIDNNGFIDVKDILYVALHYGASGTPITKASIAFDSGWIDITDKCGQSFSVVHNLNSTDIMVDITGKMTVDGGPHQKYIGLTGCTPGWQKTYGGTEDDEVYSVVRTSDGGYALAGGTSSFGAGGSDMYLVKTDAGGNMQWNKTYGGAGSDGARSVIQTNDGGYALAGVTDSFGASNDFYLVKTDESGNEEWNKTYGGPYIDDSAWSVIQTADGGYALAGYSRVPYDDFYLAKTDASGNLQWDRRYGNPGNDVAYSVVQTADGGYALAGYTFASAFTFNDCYLVKTDAAGDMQWSKTYGGINNDYAYSLVQTVDGGYALAGATYSFGASASDCYLVKTDAVGDMQWNKTYGATGDDIARSVVQTADGGYALAGNTYSFGASASDCYLVKTDAAGNMQWNKTYGGPSYDVAYSLVQTVDGGYALAGLTYSFGAGHNDFYLVKTDVENGLCWSSSTLNSITLYRGITDQYWNYVRVRIWTTT
jgi:hypothetical protein